MPDDKIRLIGLAMAGYTPERKEQDSLWRELCSRYSQSVDRPYLRAMLSFLTLGNVSEVINDDNLKLSDRLAIACRFLDDSDV